MATLRQSIVDQRAWKALASVHGFVGFWAVAGGVGLAGGGAGLTERHLEGSIFSSYLIPGLALGILVGGSAILATVQVWRHSKHALDSSLFASLVLAGWFVVQFAVVGLISWMQPFFLAILLAQIALAMQLRAHQQ